MNNIPIRDIKPPLEIDNYWQYIALIALFVAVVLLIVALVKLYKIYKNSKLDNKKFYIDKLKKIDLNNAKNASYLITKYGSSLVLDEKQKSIFNSLLDSIQKYKYRKIENIKLDNKSVELFGIFLDSLR